MSALRGQVLTGDALTVLRALPDGLVDCVVTSPPYYALRDYGVDGQLGQEPNVDAWVENVRAVARELHRVLAPQGSLWLNLADSYARHESDGAPRKSLLLGPERVARALVADGWLLRNKVVWAKTNPLPSPVADRLTSSHEFVYLLAKRASYFFDLDAIRIPHTSAPKRSRTRATSAGLGRLAGRRDGLALLASEERVGHPLGKNPSDVWPMGTSASRSGHVAPFPPSLVRRPILATCPERVCTNCARPWRRAARRTPAATPELVPCGCDAPTRPGVVLDPFIGTGTVARVAEELGRDWIGIELNPAYADMARRRAA